MRENIKKQLFEALEEKSDLNVKTDSKTLSNLLEEAIFEVTGKNSKDRSYREKSKKIHLKLKGPRNANVRKALKLNFISPKDFCSLNDKQLEDESYFNGLIGETAINNNNEKKGGMIGLKPPKLNIPTFKVDLNNNQEEENIENYFNSAVKETEEQKDNKLTEEHNIISKIEKDEIKEDNNNKIQEDNNLNNINSDVKVLENKEQTNIMIEDNQKVSINDYNNLSVDECNNNYLINS